MIWLLDTGPLVLLASHFDFDEGRQWPADTLHVTTHVVDETKQPSENVQVSRLLEESRISLAVAKKLCEATRRKLNNRIMPTRIASVLASWTE